jgi:hypothetical protein
MCESIVAAHSLSRLMDQRTADMRTLGSGHLERSRETGEKGLLQFSSVLFGGNMPVWLRMCMGLSLFVLVGIGLLLEFRDGAAALNVHLENRRILQLFFGMNLLALGLSIFAGRSKSGGLARWILVLPAYGIAIIDLLLAGTLMFEFRSDRLWLLGLLLPTVSLGAAWFVGLVGPTDSEPDAPSDETHSIPPPDTDGDKQPLATPKRILAVEAVSLVWSVLSVVLILAGMAVGTVAFTLLKSVLFNDRVLPLRSLGWLFEGERWLETGLYIALVPLVLILIYGSIAAGRAIFLRLSMRDRRRYYRELSRRELDFLDDAARAMAEYSEAQKYPWFWGLLYFCSGLGLLGALLFLSYAGLSSALATLRDMTVFRDLGPLLIPHEPFGLSMLFGMFGGIILVWPALQWLYRLSPRWTEFVYLREGWNTMSSEPRSEAQFYIELDTDLRNDRIEARSSFAAAQFAQQAFRRADRPARLTASAVISVFVAFFVLDIQAYMVFTRDEMIRSGYFTFEQVRYRYDDAVELQTGCYIGSRDDRPALILRYRITAPDGVAFNLDDLLTTDTLAEIERIDDIVRRADTPHAPVEPAGVRNRGKPGLDPECLPELERIYGEAAPRMRAVLRLPPA